MRQCVVWCVLCVEGGGSFRPADTDEPDDLAHYTHACPDRVRAGVRTRAARTHETGPRRMGKPMEKTDLARHDEEGAVRLVKDGSGDVVDDVCPDVAEPTGVRRRGCRTKHGGKRGEHAHDGWRRHGAC